MEGILLLVVAVALAYGVGCMGLNRKIGFGLAVFVALINVILGLIIVLCSKKKDVSFVDMNKEDKQ